MCNEQEIFQYYNFGKGAQYRGEKPALNAHFRTINASGEAGDTGYVTIRFVVNCEGKTGRFRVQQMDMNYEEKAFSEPLVKELLALTSSLDGWVIGEFDGAAVDYYQYLTFKLDRGNIMEILP